MCINIFTFIGQHIILWDIHWANKMHILYGELSFWPEGVLMRCQWLRIRIHNLRLFSFFFFHGFYQYVFQQFNLCSPIYTSSENASKYDTAIRFAPYIWIFLPSFNLSPVPDSRTSSRHRFSNEFIYAQLFTMHFHSSWYTKLSKMSGYPHEVSYSFWTFVLSTFFHTL